jgi:phage/conjugal plasmid C-4 type zinc finger TraR family protein
MDFVDQSQQAIDAVVDTGIAAHRARLAAACGNSSAYCMECEIPMPTIRLIAMPGAKRCLACQMKFELGDA